MANVAVLGSGTWGTALARLLADNGHAVTQWCPFKEEAENLSKTREHPNLKGVKLPEGISFTDDLEKAARGQELIVVAVASPYTRSTASRLAPFIEDGQRIVTVTKGIEEGTCLVQTQILEECIPNAVFGVLSGPSHAEEVIKALPTAIVSASEDRETAEFVQDIFMNPVFRVYTNHDVLGVELGASLKNVIALAAGMSDGLGFGDNIKAALMTRGIHEIAELALAMGAHPATLYGLSGIGDLIVTCSSMHSRNRRAGILMGQGMTMEEATKEVGQVVEGIYSAKAAKALADKYGEELPIIGMVYRILFENVNPLDAVDNLMRREKKMETEVPEDKLPQDWKR